MSKIVANFVLVLAGLACVAGVARAEDGDAAAGLPHVMISPTTWNFGTVWYGVDLAQDVTITNTGGRPLEILEVSSSCHCSAGVPEKKELQPGESTKMKLTYDSTANKVKVSQRITLKTNDPSQSTVVIPILGTVKPLFSFSTTVPTLNFGNVDRLEPTTRKMVITINEKFPTTFGLKLKETEVDGFKVSLKELDKNKKYELTATTIGPMDVKIHSAWVHLQTGLTEPTTLNVKLHAQVMMPVRFLRPANGTMFVLPTFPVESKRTVQLSFLTEPALDIVEIKCADKRITWKELTGKKRARSHGTTKTYEFTVPAGKEIPDDGIKVVFITDAKDEVFKELVMTITTKRDKLSRTKAHKVR